jgi:hypothetical protein
MEEQEFKNTLKKINDLKCQHSKVIFSRKGECQFAHKFLIAEREGINCESIEGEKLCGQWVNHLKDKCLFALKITDKTEELPHGKAIKLQVGGLIGMAQELNPGSPEQPPFKNINKLLVDALKKFGEFEAIPLNNVITSISAYKARQRSKR